MRSVRASCLLAGLLTAASFTLWLMARKAIALFHPGDELAFGWRLALYLWNWYVRVAPFAAIGFCLGVLVLVSILGGANLAEERKSLAAWLVLGLSTSAISAVAMATVHIWLGTASRPTPLPVDSIQWALSVLPLLLLTAMAGPAAGVAAVRVQWRMQPLKAGVKAWHVGVLVVLLSSLGPAVLLLALWVWWRSAPRGGGWGAADQGDEAAKHVGASQSIPGVRRTTGECA